jgi:hypothetical protein
MTPDESLVRRPGFVDGPRVWLADGRAWALPPRDPARDDPEYDALLREVVTAEDRADALRAGLALTIFLLDRNYALDRDALGALLTFAPDDPALAALQQDVDAFALETARRVKRFPDRGEPPAPSFWRRWRGRLRGHWFARGRA